MKAQIRGVSNENFQVYGERNVWRQLQRKGYGIASCTVAPLMGLMGVQGTIRGKSVKTTVSDKAAPCPLVRMNATLRFLRRICFGYPISPMSRSGRASSKWLS